MAFDRNGFRRIAFLGTLSASARPATLYSYETADTLATVHGTGYFNLATELGIADKLIIGAQSGADLEVSVVTSITTNVAIKSESGSGLTDNSGGTASGSISANAAKASVTMAVQLADFANAGVLKIVPGFAFKVNSVGLRIAKPATTASKLATLTTQISGTPTTGGVISATSATATPAGALIAGTAITALNTGTATDTLEINPSSVTAFVEGDGWIEFNVTDLDLANALASLNA